TGGCTNKTDFAVSSEVSKEGKVIIELRRTKPDDCKGNFPEGLKLNFTWSELQLSQHDKISFKNPISDQGRIHPSKRRTKAHRSRHSGRFLRCCRSPHRKHAARSYPHGACNLQIMEHHCGRSCTMRCGHRACRSSRLRADARLSRRRQPMSSQSA